MPNPSREAADGLPPARPMRGSRFAPHAKPKDMRGTLARLWGLTRGHRRGLLAVFALSGLVALSPVLSPLLIGRIIDGIDLREPVAVLIGLLLALYAGDWLARFGQQFVMNGVGGRIVRDIRRMLFGAMQGLPLAFFDRRQHGELMSRITNDVDNISSTLSNSLAQLMVYAFTICGVLASMLSLNVLLTAVALLAVAFIFAVTRFITNRTRPLYLEQQAILGRLNGHIEESVSGLAMVKAFNREQASVEQFERHNEAFRATATRALVWSGYLMPVTNVINNVSFVNVAVVSGLLAAQGIVGVGVISSFLLYSRQFTRPFVDIANIYNNFQSAVAGAERIFQIMDETPEPADRPDALPVDDPRGDIRIRHVTFGYDPSRPVIKDLSLDVPAGTRVAVVGATGSGKTTLINLLARFYDVDAGSIELDGHDLRDYRLHGPRGLRRAFGVVLQDPSLFSVSVCRQHRLRARQGRLHARGDPRGGEDGGCQRLHRAPARRVRHRARAGRRHALAGRAAAAHHRPRRARRRPNRHPGRGDQLGGHRHRAAHPRGDARRDPRAHLVRDCAPPLDRARLRPHRGARRRAHRRAGHPRRAAGAWREVRGHVACAER